MQQERQGDEDTTSIILLYILNILHNLLLRTLCYPISQYCHIQKKIKLRNILTKDKKI